MTALSSPMTAPSASPVFPSSAPPNVTALRLGYLALLPFVLGAALVWGVRADAHVYAAATLSAYAAVVVAFVGGIHWGLAMRHPQPPTTLLTWGIVPALVACVAVVMQPYAGLVIHGVMIVACYLVDRKVYPVQGVGAWLTLRFRLTVVASLSCFVGAAGS